MHGTAAAPQERPTSRTRPIERRYTQVAPD
jgi:hypothetical protein